MERVCRSVLSSCRCKKDLEEFYFTMRTMAPLLPVHVDTAGVFIRENPHIPREAVYHTFLLDKDNRVVLVGNPSRSEKIKRNVLANRGRKVRQTRII